MPFTIHQGSIVTMQTDAIVNAANSRLLPGGGVCGAIFEAAGTERMRAACEAIGFCPEGGAVITPGFALPARFVIHAVGPVWRGGDQGEEKALRSCYRSALALAADSGLTSVSFPLISSGIYGYPKEKALQTAMEEIRLFLRGQELAVTLVLYDGQTFQLAEKLFEN